VLILSTDFNPAPLFPGVINRIYIRPLTNVDFNQGTYALSTRPRNFLIRIGYTNLTNFQGQTNWASDPLDTVLFAETYTGLPPEVTYGQWLGFTLDRPFTYDPSRNIIVEISLVNGTELGTIGCAKTPPEYMLRQGTVVSATASPVRTSGAWHFGFDYATSNDAGITQLTAPTHFCPGAQDVRVKVKNYGLNNINRVELHWSVDGVLQSPVTVTTPLTAFGTPGSEAEVQLGNVLFAPRVQRNIRVWTTGPNGAPDGRVANDTLDTWVGPALSAGTYTVGGASPDFDSIKSVVAYLNKYGVCGPVVFNIRQGTYQGQNILNAVPGASEINTVTFQSESGNPADVICTYNGIGGNEGSADFYTWGFKDASYIRLRKLTITSTAPDYRRGISFMGISSYNIIDGCVFQMNMTSAASYSIFASGATGRDNVFTNNRFSGGIYTVYIEGTSASYAENIVFDNNELIQSATATHGVWAQYVRNFKCRNNRITVNTTTTSTRYGIRLQNGRDNCEIIGNKIEDITTAGGRYGIAVSSTNGAISDPVIIANNAIVIGAGATSAQTVFGLRVEGSTQVQVHNNSVNVTGGSPTGSYAGYFAFTTAGNNRILNNIFAHTATGRAMYYSNNTLSPGNVWDYNLYYTNGSVLIQKAAPTPTVSAANISQWKTSVPDQDLNSVSYRPSGFTATSTLATMVPDPADSACWLLNGRGVQVPGNDRDINGNPRSTTYDGGPPDIGAYEFTPALSVLPPAADAFPAVPVPGGTQAFLIGGDTVAVVRWGAQAPGTIKVRQYSGAQLTGTFSGDKMFFHLGADMPAGSYDYSVDVYYKESWLGIGPPSAAANLLPVKGSSGGTWQVQGAGSSNPVRRILSVPSTTGAAMYTGSRPLCSGAPLPPSITSVALANPLCIGDSITIQATDANTQAVTYQWGYAPSPAGPWTAIPGATRLDYHTGALTDSTWFGIAAICGSNTTPAPTIFEAPVLAQIPAATPIQASRCGIGSVTLVASAPGGTIRWYADSIGGTLLAVGDTFVTPPLSSDRTYWVETAVGKCIGLSRTRVTATITAAPALTVTLPQTLCSGGVAEVEASAAPGAYDSFIWSPAENLYMDPAATIPYDGSSASRLYVKQRFRDPGLNVGDTGFVTFTYRNNLVTHTTVRGKDGNVWLQQNLGASRVAQSPTDAVAYGDLFQWGRWDDGHQERTPGYVQQATVSPNNPLGLNLAGSNPYYYNSSSDWWATGDDQDAWTAPVPAAATADNGCDPCKALGSGWRLPTEAEFQAMMSNGNEHITDASSAFSSTLRLPMAGRREQNAGTLTEEGSAGAYWTSTPDQGGGGVGKARQFVFTAAPGSAGTSAPGFRGAGQAIRCIKQTTGQGNSYSYMVEAQNSLTGCVATGGTAVTVQPDTATATASPLSVCMTGTPLLLLDPPAGYAPNSIQWQVFVNPSAGYVDIPGADDVTYSVTSAIAQTTYYRAQVKNSAGDVCFSAPVTVNVEVPQVLSVTPDERCGPGTVTLTGKAAPGYDLNWYDRPSGGQVLMRADTFQPYLTTSQTFYVSAGNGAAYVTGVSELGGTGGTVAAANLGTGGIIFNALTPFTLHSVAVYPVGTGAPAAAVIQLKNASGLTLASKTVNFVTSPLPGVKTVVQLDFPVPAGTDLRLVVSAWTLGSSLEGLAYDRLTGGIPWSAYTVPGVIEMTNSTVTGDAQYRFFYDWHISTGCEGNRTPVTATVTPPPAFSITDAYAACGDGVARLTVTSPSGNYDTYTWTPAKYLYSDPAATIPYTAGTNASTVYMRKPRRDPGSAIGDTGSVTVSYRNTVVSYKTVRAADGNVWLQQNLGSLRTGNSVTDHEAYGDLFQWGRWDDGHQYIVRNSGTQNGIPPVGSSVTYIGTPVPNNPEGLKGGAGRDTFYSSDPITLPAPPHWWAGGQASNTWDAPTPADASVARGSDPCQMLGPGWRLPTVAEWTAVRDKEGIATLADAISSNLKIVASGLRSGTNGQIGNAGSDGFFWSSTPVSTNGAQARGVRFSATGITAGDYSRSSGFAIRCIKADPQQEDRYSYVAHASESVNGCQATDTGVVYIQPTGIRVETHPGDSLCISGATTLHLVPDAGYAPLTGVIQWQQSSDGINFADISGGGATSYATPSLSQTTWYRGQVKNSAGGVCAEPLQRITVIDPQVTATFDSVHCGPGQVELRASGSPASLLNWYTTATGGVPIASGSTFVTPVINTTTTYYVGAKGADVTKRVGRNECVPAYYSGLYEYLLPGTTGNPRGLAFDAYVPLAIRSVAVYPVPQNGGAPGIDTIEVAVLDVLNNVVNSTSVAVRTIAAPGVKTRIPVNLSVPAGMGYKLVFMRRTGNLALLGDNGSIVFPYTLPGVISINAVTSGSTAWAHYFYDWEVTTACESPRLPVRATVTPAPALSISPATPKVCENDEVTLTASSQNGGYTYFWERGSAGASIQARSASSRFFHVRAEDNSGGPNNGCIAEDSVLVTVLPAPIANVVSLGIPEFCKGDSLILVASGVGNSWQWLRNDGVIPGATQFSYAVKDSGYYTVVMTDSNFCRDTASGLRVIVNPLPDPVITRNGMELSTSPGFVLYQWNRNGQTIPGATQYRYTASGDGVYTVSVTDANGCFATSSPEQVGVNVPVVYASDPVRIWPNPTSSVVHVSAPGPVNISVLTMEGKVAFFSSNSSLINVGHLADGAYLIRVTDQSGIILKQEKLIKLMK
jgi:hypothetical protein